MWGNLVELWLNAQDHRDDSDGPVKQSEVDAPLDGDGSAAEGDTLKYDGKEPTCPRHQLPGTSRVARVNPPMPKALRNVVKIFIGLIFQKRLTWSTQAEQWRRCERLSLERRAGRIREVKRGQAWPQYR